MWQQMVDKYGVYLTDGINSEFTFDKWMVICTGGLYQSGSGNPTSPYTFVYANKWCGSGSDNNGGGCTYYATFIAIPINMFEYMSYTFPHGTSTPRFPLGPTYPI